MTGWHAGPMTPFDIESGGVDVEEHRIVTITVGSIQPTDGRPKVNMWSGLIAVDVDIDPAATEVHGITTEYARENGKPAAEVLDEAAGLLALSLHRGVPVVGMNLVFDFSILDRECRRWGVPTVDDRMEGRPLAPVIDVLVLDKFLDRYRPGKRKLVDLCALYGVRNDAAHDAVEDALAAARVAYVIGRRSQLSADEIRALYADRRYPDRLARDWRRLGELSLNDLHGLQIEAYRDQSENFAAYLRKEAGQKLHEAEQAVDRDEFNLAADLKAEAKDLLARADGVTTVWPMQPPVAS